MLVRVHAGSASVEEPDDLGRLHVATALDPRRTGEALRAAGLGDVDRDGAALLPIATLRDRARAGAVRHDWDDRWEATIGYATERGWVSDDGRTVRAHLEPVG